jgi:hypothetical protein
MAAASRHARQRWLDRRLPVIWRGGAVTASWRQNIAQKHRKKKKA